MPDLPLILRLIGAMAVAEQEKNEAANYLRQLFPPGATAYTMNRGTK